MKHPPKFVWVATCPRCGEVTSASKRVLSQQQCQFCVGSVLTDAYRYRLESAIGAKK